LFNLKACLFELNSTFVRKTKDSFSMPFVLDILSLILHLGSGLSVFVNFISIKKKTIST